MAVSKENQFVLGSLTGKHLFTFFLWCLVQEISSLVFSDWHSIAISGSLNFLPYLLAVSLMMWPWTSVVISGVVFTVGAEKSEDTPITNTSVSIDKHNDEVMMLGRYAIELPAGLVTLDRNKEESVRSQSAPSKIAMEGVYSWTSDCGSWIFSFVSALLLCHLAVMFMSIFLSWSDVLMTGFQYRSFLFIFIIVVLSVLLIVVFLGLSLEWLGARSPSNDQQLRPCDDIVAENEALIHFEHLVADQVIDCDSVMEEVTVYPHHTEVFIQSTEGILLDQKEEDEGDLTSLQSCDGMELEELLTELNEVVHWFNFGVNLEIPEAKLKEIERKYESVESCKKEMLTVWMQLTCPTWKAIVIALAGIDLNDLALRIAVKYSVSFPPSLRYVIHQLERTGPDSERLMPFDLAPLITDCDVDSSSISSQDVNGLSQECITATQTVLAVSYYVTRGKRHLHYYYGGYTLLIQMSLPPPNESNVFETVTNDTEHVGEISDDKTQQLLNLTSPSSDEVHEMVEWIPDSKAKKCFQCQAKFTAIKRRHHCRSCGQIFCNTCSKRKIILVYLGCLKPERVCDECYRKQKSGDSEVFNSVHEKEEDEYVLIT